MLIWRHQPVLIVCLKITRSLSWDPFLSTEMPENGGTANEEGAGCEKLCSATSAGTDQLSVPIRWRTHYAAE